MVKKLEVLVVIFVLMTTNLFAQSIFKLELKEEKQDCMGVAPMKCYLVKYDNSKEWENFYGHLENFNYEEGYRYELLVKRKKLKNVPADHSSYSYKVKKIISKKTMKPQNEGAFSFLEKHSWKLISLNGKIQENSHAFINFDFGNNTVNGNSSCNNFFGGVKLKKNAISFTDIASTKMACLDGNIESEFFDLLSLKDLTYDVAEQTFNLYSANQLIAIFGMMGKEGR